MKLIKSQVGPEYIYYVGMPGWARWGTGKERKASKLIVWVAKVPWTEKGRRWIMVDQCTNALLTIPLSAFTPLHCDPLITEHQLLFIAGFRKRHLSLSIGSVKYCIGDKVLLSNLDELGRTAKGLVQVVALIDEQGMYIEQTIRSAEDIVEHSLFIVEEGDEILKPHEDGTVERSIFLVNKGDDDGDKIFIAPED